MHECFYCRLRVSLLYCTLDVGYLANIQFDGINKNFTGKKFSKTNKRRMGGGGRGGAGRLLETREYSSTLPLTFYILTTTTYNVSNIDTIPPTIFSSS